MNRGNALPALIATFLGFTRTSVGKMNNIPEVTSITFRECFPSATLRQLRWCLKFPSDSEPLNVTNCDRLRPVSIQFITYLNPHHHDQKLLLVLVPVIAVTLLTSEQMSDNGKAAKTGAPGEVDCTDCHSDFGINSGGGSISITATGIPTHEYTPGQTYNMSVTVARSANSLFGVGIEALTASNANGSTLNITDATHTQIKSATVSGVSPS